jgi:sulfate transport system substrate-binding protein
MQKDPYAKQKMFCTMSLTLIVIRIRIVVVSLVMNALVRAKRPIFGLLLVINFGALMPTVRAETALLNVSYDVTRELFKDINPLFLADWKRTHPEELVINQSHGGSSKQARSVADGLQASVVTMNQANDIDLLVDAKVVDRDWSKRFPHSSSPFYSTIVFLVRKGNPKGIRDWSDLSKPGVKSVIPNPKTSGNGRYSYLASWGSVIRQGGTEAQARDQVARLFRNVPVLDTGGRAASTTFTQRGIGDVLVTFENEVHLIKKELGEQFEIVYPPLSILAESSVSVVDKVVDRKNLRKQATGYLQFLYTDTAQDVIARHYFRPRSDAIAKKYVREFKAIQLFTVDELFGGWKSAQKKHFDDGGEFDQIFQLR